MRVGTGGTITMQIFSRVSSRRKEAALIIIIIITINRTGRNRKIHFQGMCINCLVRGINIEATFVTTFLLLLSWFGHCATGTKSFFAKDRRLQHSTPCFSLSVGNKSLLRCRVSSLSSSLSTTTISISNNGKHCWCC